MIMFMHNAHVHDLALSCTCERTGKCRFSIPQYDPECICSIVHVQHRYEYMYMKMFVRMSLILFKYIHMSLFVYMFVFIFKIWKGVLLLNVYVRQLSRHFRSFFSLQFLDKIETFLPIKLGRWMSIKSTDLGWSKTGNKISWHCQRVWRSWHDAGQQKRIKNSGKLIGNWTFSFYIYLYCCSIYSSCLCLISHVRSQLHWSEKKLSPFLSLSLSLSFLSQLSLNLWLSTPCFSSFVIHVVDPNTLNLDPDPGSRILARFWSGSGSRVMLSIVLKVLKKL